MDYCILLVTPPPKETHLETLQGCENRSVLIVMNKQTEPYRTASLKYDTGRPARRIGLVYPSQVMAATASSHSVIEEEAGYHVPPPSSFSPHCSRVIKLRLPFTSLSTPGILKTVIRGTVNT